jgi:hypothetical protein
VKDTWSTWVDHRFVIVIKGRAYNQDTGESLGEVAKMNKTTQMTANGSWPAFKTTK